MRAMQKGNTLFGAAHANGKVLATSPNIPSSALGGVEVGD